MTRPAHPSRGDRPGATLRILATSDLHVNVLGYDYFADAPSTDMGLARTAQLITKARRQVQNCLLLDNGDFLQGNPLGDYIARQRGISPGRPHPVLAAMNALGYDAATLGNHEFNYGLDYLQAVLAGAGFPIVLANIVRKLGPDPAQDTPFLLPHTILTRDLICHDGQTRSCRIGVIGLAPPQIVQWDRAVLGGALQAREIVATAAALVPRLRAAGAEIVVALAHSGIEPADTTDQHENAATRLAALPGIDAVVAGHTHLVFPTPDFPPMPGVDPLRGQLSGKPAVMPGANGSHLGVIDLDLTQDADGWRMSGSRAEVRPICAPGKGRPMPALRRVSQVVVGDHRAALDYIRRPIGHSHIPLHSFFATVAPNQGMRVVAEAQAHWVAQQVAGRPEAALPLLSAVAPFKVGGRGGPKNFTDIPAGPLSLRHVADLYMFPNTVAALRVTGAELAEWLEISAGIFSQVAAGSDGTVLIDADFPAYNHDRILGLSYALDLTRPRRYDRHGQLVAPASRRVRDLCHFGRPVNPDQQFLLATNSYRAAGSGGYPARPEALVDLDRAELREVLLTHIAEGMPVRFSILPHFRFAPLGARVIHDTSPLAETHLDEIADLRPEILGMTENGFLRLALHL